MHIQFSGAAREVTGSCHILRVGTRTILLDCGLFQGRRSESREKNARLPLPVQEIDAVILSHAHIDHCGNLPGLVKAGYRGPIFCTEATADVAEIMMIDSAHIAAEDSRYLRDRLRPGHLPDWHRHDETQ